MAASIQVRSAAASSPPGREGEWRRVSALLPITLLIAYVPHRCYSYSCNHLVISVSLIGRGAAQG